MSNNTVVPSYADDVETRVSGAGAQEDGSQQAGTVGYLLAAVAAATPSADAIVTPTERVSCRALYDRALFEAASLDGTDTRPLAVRQDGSIDAIVTAFGVMMSGRALIAIDDRLPSSRVDNILEMSGGVVVSGLGQPAIVSAPGSGEGAARPDDIAMINFTSGSTGDPKGVLLSHRTVVAKALDVVAGQGLRSDDRVADLLPLGFSAGITTLIAGVACGATVLCTDPRDTDLGAIIFWLRAQAATTIHASVVLSRSLGIAIRDGVVPPLRSVRQISLYGEPATGGDVTAARCLAEPTPVVVNWYAATEVGVVAHAVIAPDDAVADGRVPAGRPLADRSLTVVDDNGDAIVDGAVGEVVLTGGSIADGYLGRTSPRFLPDSGAGRGYRTGDRGRIDEAGDLHLIGRVDDAVKIRGYLVEPSEVETALHRLAGVEEVYVASTETDSRVELVAYVSGLVTAGRDFETRLRAALRADLPEWMVPRHIIGVPALPRTERGKLDRAALPRPEAPTRSRRGSPDVVEAAVRLAVTIAMGTDDIDSDQDLIAFGADSLALTLIATTVRQRLNADIDLAAFTASPTIATLADSVRNHNRGGVRLGDGILIPIRTGDDTTPLFVVSGAGAPAASLISLVRNMSPGRAVYGLQALGLERTGRPDHTVAAMARRYVDLIVAVQPHGPYLLAGHSMGGIVALEMAAQFAEQGEQTAHVVQIDGTLSEPLLADLDVAVAGPDDDFAADSDHVAPYQPDVQLSKRQMISLIVKLPLAGRIIFDPVTQWIIFFRHGGQVTRKHRLRRIDAPLTVLCAPGTVHKRSWWRAVTTGPVEMRSVRGGHVEMLHEPYVADVATGIDEVLGSFV